MKFVIHPAIDDQRLKAIEAVAPALHVINCDSIELAQREIVDADAFFGKMTLDLLTRAKQLRWVQSPTASLEHYLFPELIQHPCLLSNMRGLFSDVVADHVMGFVLCFARNLHIYLRQQQQSLWSPVGDQAYVTNFVSGPGTVLPFDRTHQHLADCSLGVVGAGNIGREILRRAAAFGMTVSGVDPKPLPVPGVTENVRSLDRLPDLLRSVDYVVIAAPQTPETTGLFRRSLIQQMKRSAVLINIGRGPIVNLDDLADALEANEIRGAALDVCDPEPLPADHRLWRMPNVIITPHVAAASPRIAQRHLETLLENTRRFVLGEQPATLVDKRSWY